jgi:hypothetical protein
MTETYNAADIRSRIMQFTSQAVPFKEPEFGDMYLRRLTLGELDRMQEENRKPVVAGERPIPTTVRLLARFIGDDKGLPVFNLEAKADLDCLLAMPVGVAANILRAGNKINNMEEPKAGDEKN